VASNQWGVDVSYFSRELDALKKSLPNCPPAELYRYLLRLAAIVEPAQAQATADNIAMVEIALVLRDLVIASTEGVEQRTADSLSARLDAVIARLRQ